MSNPEFFFDELDQIAPVKKSLNEKRFPFVKFNYSFLITSDEKVTVFDHAADELELIAVSKRPTKQLPPATVIRSSHVQEKISRQLNVMKTNLKAVYRLSDLPRARKMVE